MREICTQIEINENDKHGKTKRKRKQIRIKLCIISFQTMSGKHFYIHCGLNYLRNTIKAKTGNIICLFITISFFIQLTGLSYNYLSPYLSCTACWPGVKTIIQMMIAEVNLPRFEDRRNTIIALGYKLFRIPIWIHIYQSIYLSCYQYLKLNISNTQPFTLTR